VLHPTIDGEYFKLVSGRGVWVKDAQGREYLDSVSGVGVVALGYGRDDLVAAASRQAAELPYAHSMRYRNAPQDELADRLAAVTPPGLSWSFFCSGGSEALDSVVKLVRLYWLERGEPGRWKVIGRRPSYHGNTLMALSVGYHPLRRAPYAPLLVDMPHLATPWIFHCEQHGPDGPWCRICSGAALEDLILEEGPESIAAFIAEPLVGAAAPGVTPPPGYYETIRAICDRYGVLFISDEVMTGLGRTGRDWGIQHWDAVPDLMITAKGIGAGYASIAAVVAHERVIEVLRSGSGRFEHNFTMAGNPLACAVSCAVLDAYERENIVDHVDAVAPALRKLLLAMQARHPLVGDVRGKGLHLGLELTQPGTNAPLPPELKAAQALDLLAREEGLLIYPCSGILDGLAGEAILLLPALVINNDECQELANRLDRALGRLEEWLLPQLTTA
jgi:adenosylmethionine-8-amino-7-oxononanoate aminotransferase